MSLRPSENNLGRLESDHHQRSCSWGELAGSPFLLSEIKGQLIRGDRQTLPGSSASCVESSISSGHHQHCRLFEGRVNLEGKAVMSLRHYP